MNSCKEGVIEVRSRGVRQGEPVSKAVDDRHSREEKKSRTAYWKARTGSMKDSISQSKLLSQNTTPWMLKS